MTIFLVKLMSRHSMSCRSIKKLDVFIVLPRRETSFLYKDHASWLCIQPCRFMHELTHNLVPSQSLNVKVHLIPMQGKIVSYDEGPTIQNILFNLPTIFQSASQSVTTSPNLICSVQLYHGELLFLCMYFLSQPLKIICDAIGLMILPLEQFLTMPLQQMVGSSLVFHSIKKIHESLMN